MENINEIKKLVLSAQMNNKESFSKLIQIVEKELFRIAKLRLDNFDDANDAVQETYFMAFNSISQLKNPDYFKTWIIKILINECNKIHAKNYKNELIFQNASAYEYTSSSNGITNLETKLAFDQALKILTDEEKLLIELFYKHRYSISDISKQLKMNSNTVNTKLFRARQKLKKTL